jgi:hypothetical protein
MLQLFECLLLRFRPKEFFFHSSLGDLTQGSSDMRESQHKPVVEIGKTQKSTDLFEGGWGWPIPNEFDLGWIHMHPPLINNVSQILNPGHAKSALLQIGTQLVLPQCLEDPSDVVEVLFPSLAEYQNVIQVHHYK